MGQDTADWAGIWEETAFDREAVAKEEGTPRWRAQEHIVDTLLDGFSGLEVIEVGSGRGLNAMLYAKRGADATLLDVEDVALEQAAKVYGDHGLSFTPVRGDVFDLPPELLGRFDVSMSFGLCEHFRGEQRRRVVAAHIALLKPGGIAMIGVPNRISPVYRVWKRVLEQRGSWPFGTEEPYTAHELARIAEEAGGKPLEPAYGSFLSSFISHGVNQILYKLGGRGLPLPQTSVPLLDRLAYELLLPIRRPGLSTS